MNDSYRSSRASTALLFLFAAATVEIEARPGRMLSAEGGLPNNCSVRVEGGALKSRIPKYACVKQIVFPYPPLFPTGYGVYSPQICKRCLLFLLKGSPKADLVQVKQSERGYGFAAFLTRAAEPSEFVGKNFWTSYVN